MNSMTTKESVFASPLGFLVAAGAYEAYQALALMAGSWSEFQDFQEFVPPHCRLPFGDAMIREELRRWRKALLGDPSDGASRRRYVTAAQRDRARVVIQELFEEISLATWYADVLAKDRPPGKWDILLTSATHYPVLGKAVDLQPRGRLPGPWLKVDVNNTTFRAWIGRTKLHEALETRPEDFFSLSEEVGTVLVELATDHLTLGVLEACKWTAVFPEGQTGGCLDLSHPTLASVSAVLRLPSKTLNPFFAQIRPALGWVCGLEALVVQAEQHAEFCAALTQLLREALHGQRVGSVVTTLT